MGEWGSIDIYIRGYSLWVLWIPGFGWLYVDDIPTLLGQIFMFLCITAVTSDGHIYERGCWILKETSFWYIEIFSVQDSGPVLVCVLPNQSG